MRMQTEGLVLQVRDTGETDRLLTILTRDYGVIRAFANGAKTLKSRTQSATQLLAYSRFSFYRGRDTYTVNEAQTITLFFSAHEDLAQLSLAQYFCELAMQLAPQESPAAESLQLILNALHVLSQNRRPHALVKSVVELRLLCLAGYMPDLTACTGCGDTVFAEEPLYFSLQEGGLRCHACGAPGEEIGRSVLHAMRHICMQDAKRIFSFTLPKPALVQLEHVCERFLLTQTQHRFSTLAFYRVFAQDVG